MCAGIPGSQMVGIIQHILLSLNAAGMHHGYWHGKLPAMPIGTEAIIMIQHLTYLKGGRGFCLSNAGWQTCVQTILVHRNVRALSCSRSHVHCDSACICLGLNQATDVLGRPQ